MSVLNLDCHFPASEFGGVYFPSFSKPQDLEASCETLTDESMSRLAYAFLTCHLQQHRRDIQICENSATMDRYFINS